MELKPLSNSQANFSPLLNKEFLISLTQKIYQLTILFPKKEPLRYKMRELADDILANPQRADLETLECYFEIARPQNWVDPTELLNLQQEYSKLKGELAKELPLLEIKKPQEFQEIVPPQPVFTTTNPRQQKILEILKEKEKIQVWEVKRIFPEITKRTLRRDFESLFKQGLIKRIGERNATFYQLTNIA